MLGWSKLYSVTVGQFGPQMHDSDSDKDVRMLDRHPEVRKLFIKYEGHSINKLQNSVILLVFQI